MDEDRPLATDVAELRALLGHALTRIEELTGEVADLRRSAPSDRPPVQPDQAPVGADLTPVEAPDAPDVDAPSTQLVGRRHALKGAALAAGAAAAGIVLGDANPAAANNGDTLKLGQIGQSASAETAWSSSNLGTTLRVTSTSDTAITAQTNSANGTAIVGLSENNGQGIGVSGYTYGGTGVLGSIANDGPGTGVAGYAEGGIGVQGQATTGPGVEGLSTSGVGVHGKAASNVGVFGEATNSYGVSGKSTNSIGIYGFTAASNLAGVYGESTQSVGVHGKSVGNVGVAGEAANSYGVSGVSQTNIGVYGSTASASMAGVFGDGATGAGVHGRSTNNVGVYGETTSTSTGYGVQAYSAGSVGLKAVGKTYGAVAQSFSTSATDAALYASSIQANAIGASTDSGLVLTGVSDSGGGIEVKAPTFHLRLANASTRNAPTADGFAHLAGEIVYATSGDTWVCVKGGTPGTWRKVAGQATAGSFHVLAAPVRVYDSRSGTAPSTGPKTPLAANVARTIDLKGNSSGVPAGATAALVTVLLLNTASGNGNFTLWAAGVAKPSANTMVWGGAAGGRYTAKEVSALDATARVQVSSSIKADIALDVVGYYR